MTQAICVRIAVNQPKHTLKRRLIQWGEGTLRYGTVSLRNLGFSAVIVVLGAAIVVIALKDIADQISHTIVR